MYRLIRPGIRFLIGEILSEIFEFNLVQYTVLDKTKKK